MGAIKETQARCVTSIAALLVSPDVSQGAIKRLPVPPGTTEPCYGVEAQSGDICHINSWVYACHQVCNQPSTPAHLSD
jgi:hypothetical protein